MPVRLHERHRDSVDIVLRILYYAQNVGVRWRAVLSRFSSLGGAFRWQFVGGGKSAAISISQSLLVSRRSALALIIDSDSIVKQKVQEEAHICFDFFRSYAPNVPGRCLMVVPEIEAALFSKRSLLASELGIEIEEQLWRDAASSPKRVLKRLLKRRRLLLEEFIAQLSEDAIDEVARTPLFEALLLFLRRPSGVQYWIPDFS